MRVDGHHPPQQTTEPIQIFSPSLERRREAYATMGDDPYARAEGSRVNSSHSAESAATQQSSAVWRGPAAQPLHTPHPGFSSQPLFGQSPPQPHGAPGNAAYPTPVPSIPSIPLAIPSGMPPAHSVPLPASVPPQGSNTRNYSSYGSFPANAHPLYPDGLQGRQIVPPDHIQRHMGAPGPPMRDESDAASMASAVTAETIHSSQDSNPNNNPAVSEGGDDQASDAGSIRSEEKYSDLGGGGGCSGVGRG